MNRSGLTRALLFLTACFAVACGKKGPPLAPLYLVPSAVSDVSARRVEDAIRLRFVLPSKNVNGPGIDLDRVEIFAVTVEPGSETPPNRELLSKPYLAGQIQVKPPPVEGAPETPEDKRPGPGEAVTFAEQLSSLPPPPRRRVTKKPEPSGPPAPTASEPAPPPAPTAPGATPESGLTTTGVPTAPAASSAGVAPPTPPTSPAEKTAPPTATSPTAAPRQPQAAEAPIKVTQPMRVYVVRGVARNGHGGPPSARIAVPLSTVPDAPGGLKAQNTEKAVIVEWLPAVVPAGGSRMYNVYKADAPDEPLNPKPLAKPSYEQAGVELGTEVCFRVRAVEGSGPVSIESPLSEPACVTPKDVFPPATPKGLATVSTPGAVQLIWDANTDADLAGYIVLRAEPPDETLQPLTPTPIRDAVFKDGTVTPGVRYLYAIVAVDSATPPNRSTPSERVEAIAR